MSAPAECRIYISAGEASGDAHAAQLARALPAALPGAVLEGTGGPLMAAAGVSLRHSLDPLGASGLFEAIRTVPAHARLFRDLRRRFRNQEYDLLIVVDYPGFHLRLAACAASAGIPVLYYIAPQLWAWGQGRAARLSAAARSVAVVLPFEQPFLRALGVNATFVGHPLLDQAAPPTRRDARDVLGLPSGVPVLGLFPGSRRHEVRRLWPVMREAASLVQRAVPDLEVVVATTDGRAYDGGGRVHRTGQGSRLVMAAADAAICKSGTTTLEAVLADLPMAITYRLHPWTHALARRMLRVNRIGLANLVAGRDVAPELVQDDATPERLAAAVLPLLDRDGRAAREQRAGFERIRARLGSPGASTRVAALARALVA